MHIQFSFSSDFKLNNQHYCHHKSSWQQHYQEKAHLKNCIRRNPDFVSQLQLVCSYQRETSRKQNKLSPKEHSIYGILEFAIRLGFPPFSSWNDFYEFIVEYTYPIFYIRLPRNVLLFFVNGEERIRTWGHYYPLIYFIFFIFYGQSGRCISDGYIILIMYPSQIHYPLCQ